VIERLPRRGRVLGLATALVVVAAGIGVAARLRPPAPSAEAFCRELAAAEGLDEALGTLDVTRIEPQAAALRRAEAVAPDEIRPSVTSVRSLVEAVTAGLRTARGDPRAALESALQDHRGTLAAVEEAGAALEAYASGTCGLTLAAPPR
jgi:hypothetical protein